MKLFLVVYVDDFKMSGPREHMDKGWRLIRSRVHRGDPAPASLYLGCLHEFHDVKMLDGKRARAVVYNMEEYLKSTVEKYCKLVRQHTGGDPVLRKVSTPFLQEDHKDAPAARPSADGESTVCPWCKHSFSPTGAVLSVAGTVLSAAKKKGKSLASPTDAPTEPRVL